MKQEQTIKSTEILITLNGENKEKVLRTYVIVNLLSMYNFTIFNYYLNNSDPNKSDIKQYTTDMINAGDKWRGYYGYYNDNQFNGKHFSFLDQKAREDFEKAAHKIKDDPTLYADTKIVKLLYPNGISGPQLKLPITITPGSGYNNSYLDSTDRQGKTLRQKILDKVNEREEVFKKAENVSDSLLNNKGNFLPKIGGEIDYAAAQHAIALIRAFNTNSQKRKDEEQNRINELQYEFPSYDKSSKCLTFRQIEEKITEQCNSPTPILLSKRQSKGWSKVREKLIKKCESKKYKSLLDMEQRKLILEKLVKNHCDQNSAKVGDTYLYQLLLDYPELWSKNDSLSKHVEYNKLSQPLNPITLTPPHLIKHPRWIPYSETRASNHLNMGKVKPNDQTLFTTIDYNNGKIEKDIKTSAHLGRNKRLRMDKKGLQFWDAFTERYIPCNLAGCKLQLIRKELERAAPKGGILSKGIQKIEAVFNDCIYKNKKIDLDFFFWLVEGITQLLILSYKGKFILSIPIKLNNEILPKYEGLTYSKNENHSYWNHSKNPSPKDPEIGKILSIDLGQCIALSWTILETPLTNPDRIKISKWGHFGTASNKFRELSDLIYRTRSLINIQNHLVLAKKRTSSCIEEYNKKYSEDQIVIDTMIFPYPIIDFKIIELRNEIKELYRKSGGSKEPDFNYLSLINDCVRFEKKFHARAYWDAEVGSIRKRLKYNSCPRHIRKLQKKLVDLRKDWTNKIANRTTSLALDNKCNLICLESLFFKNKYQNSRTTNKNLTNWCVRTIINKIKIQAHWKGIHVLETNPAYTSSYSARTRDYGIRVDRIDGQMKPAWCGKHLLVKTAEGFREYDSNINAAINIGMVGMVAHPNKSKNNTTTKDIMSMPWHSEAEREKMKEKLMRHLDKMNRKAHISKMLK